MIDQSEIVSTLAPINGLYFNIPDVSEYANKIATLGKSIEVREKQSNQLLSYILYYDNKPEMFITMVWTHPEHRGNGLAKRLMRELIHLSPKSIRLEVHKDNPALKLYQDLGFALEEQAGDKLTLIRQKTIVIMQPYCFPYIGYFHLIDASDLFVFYDDVHFIKKGWIHRNRLLLNGKDHGFTIPIKDASQNRLINETRLAIDGKWKETFNKTLEFAYRKAPFFSPVMDLINSTFASEHDNISDLAITSVVKVCEYLGIKLNYAKSSVLSPETRGMEKADRLIEISKRSGYTRYINAAGGIELYNKDCFKAKGVDLGFVQSSSVEYKQFSNEFVPGLSIIDVMMFNDVNTIKKFFKEYKVS